MRIIKLISIFFLLFTMGSVSAQFTPIAIAGFNQDVVAESGSSSLATTTMPLDGVNVSNKVLYAVSFRDLNGFGGGALPDNGFITNSSGTYQLHAYTENNALLLQRGQSGNILINNPAQFSKLRLAAFSTEGASLLNIELHFTDGSTSAVLSQYNLPDWFGGTSNLVETGFGRCTRKNGVAPSDADGFPTNPRLYYIEIPMGCVERTRFLDKINISNVTTAGTNAPYPNAVFMALSGENFAGVSANTTSATCTTNGSATLNVSLPQPFSVTWNTNPVQTGITASNLSPGNYTATIDAGGGCVVQHNVTIGLINNIYLLGLQSPTICQGATATPSANINTNAQTFSWSPATAVSNVSILQPVFSPQTTTTYTLTAGLGSCSKTYTYKVTVNPSPELFLQTDTTICQGDSFVANASSANAQTFSWSPVTGVSDPTILQPVFSPTADITYTLIATAANNCTASKTLSVVVAPEAHAGAGDDVTISQGMPVQLNGTATPGTYLWTPGSGLSAVNILTPIATPQETTTYTLTVTSAAGCTASDEVKITVIPDCVKPMHAITPNADGINDKWIVTNSNCILKTSVHVYNRYGHLVYENRDYRNDWQGTFKGKALPDATYYFVVEYSLADGRTASVKGDLTIIR